MPRVTVLLLLVLAALAVPAAAQAAGPPVVRGSVEQVQVTGATPGASVRLVDDRGRAVATQTAGALGGVVFRTVSPGGGYRVQAGGTTSAAVRVLSTRSAPPSTAPYDQAIPAKGYGYLTTRDGTQLAINVQLPAGPGPYPTLVEYSGYGYANPAGGESSIAQIAVLLGYAVVDVNMRGTGCSGGAFDYFEPLQGLDGYDVIETVARQPWVARHRVGMMGISYGGISQLFVGATRPPSLAAITPLSVIDDTATTLYPGGILNTGFALSWAKDRVHDALPASPTGGQGWALKRIQEGDATCAANQALHDQAVDLLRKIDENRFYVPAVADPLAPRTFVHRIQAPVFLACQFTDEQTGGHCPTLASRFTGTSRKWFTFTNGTHIDSLDPATFNRWFDFLELYVAHRAPNLTPAPARARAHDLQRGHGRPGRDAAARPDPGPCRPTPRRAGRSRRCRPCACSSTTAPAAPRPARPWRASSARSRASRCPARTARSWYLGRGGTLDDLPGPAARARTRSPGTRRRGRRRASPATPAPGGLWTATPAYNWVAAPGRARRCPT